MYVYVKKKIIYLLYVYIYIYIYIYIFTYTYICVCIFILQMFILMCACVYVQKYVCSDYGNILCSNMHAQTPTHMNCNNCLQQLFTAYLDDTCINIQKPHLYYK